MNDPRTRLGHALAPDETLRWTGAPRRGIFFRRSDAFLIPFSLLWAGFIVFWEVSVLRSKNPFPFALFGIPFLLVGAYIVFGRFFVDALARSRTAYGVTERRVLIVSGILSSTVTSHSLANPGTVSMREKGDGSGTISLGTPHPMTRYMAGMRWPGMEMFQVPELEEIPDVRRVFDLIQNPTRM